ncbi:hypothetical protein DRQ26_07180 [bacterium]|nr:MAG: hypothetical protein DRQ26_07180 [bacterium]
MKKVLFITDDLKEIGFGIKDRIHEYTKPDYQVTFVEKLEDVHHLDFANYDCIIMDYGFIGDLSDAEFRAMNASAKLGWCGALSERYNHDAKNSFPKLKFLHNLPSADISDFGWLLDYIY